MFIGVEKIKLKSKLEIKKMRVAGKVTGKLLEELNNIIKPGITTEHINSFTEQYIRSFKMIPAFLGVKGISINFPASACVSVNDEVVHGIPNKSRMLRSGDIVSVDVGTIYNGYYSDAAKTYAVGDVSKIANKLINITKLSLELGIKQVIPGNKIGDISFVIQRLVEDNGFTIVKDFVGHGIGKSLHENPQIPNFGKKNTGLKLIPGMVFTIEPMVNVGNYEVYINPKNNWTVLTKDKSLSAHFEHTIAVTEDGCEILTNI
ncbi:MAG: type I methionyl aminopeptidase [Endomicrobium sp.]|jgi:methionyl aminopeptidase|nr:type I methionyl aminopeptidase [Endomicrobium sp.]